MLNLEYTAVSDKMSYNVVMRYIADMARYVRHFHESGCMSIIGGKNGIFMGNNSY